MLLYAGIFFSTAFLIFGAYLAVRGARALASKFLMRGSVIGFSVVAFGASLPELSLMLTSVLSGETTLPLSAIVGSSLGNVLLVLGLGALMTPLLMRSETVYREVPMLFLTALGLLFLANDRYFNHSFLNYFSGSDGAILLTIFGVFMYYVFGIAKDVTIYDPDERAKLGGIFGAIVYLFFGFLFLIGGSGFLYMYAMKLSLFWGAETALVGLTVISLILVMPELAIAFAANYHKDGDLVIGTVVGSTLFSLLWALGIGSLYLPLPIADLLLLDIKVLLGASLILFLFLFVGKKHTLERWQGGLLVILYILYMISFIVRS